MKKHFVRVKTIAGPRYLSGFQQVGSKPAPILTGIGCALMLKLSTAAYLCRKLEADGYDASVEEVSE